MPTLILTHGLQVKQDLPLPLGYLLAGGVSALVISFAGLIVLWRRSRFRGNAGGRPLPTAAQTMFDSSPFRWALRTIGVLLTGFAAVAAIFGPDLTSNPTVGLVYVIFWVGLVPLSLLLGPVWKLLNPLRTIHLLLCRALRRNPETGMLALPSWVGYWPAAMSLYSFVWLELAAPDRATLPVLRIFFAIYAATHIIAATCFGSRWFDKADGFEVYSSLIGRFALLGRSSEGRLVVRNPFDGLDGLPVAPGLSATVCVLLGSTAFDGFTRSTIWMRLSQYSAVPPAALATAGLVTVILLVGACYVAAAKLSGMFGTTRPQDLPGAFAHAIVPIAVGYLIAHYFSFFIYGGQQTLSLASDPLVNGANLFGTRGHAIDYAVVSSMQIALVQLFAVVTGHVLGVVATHDRAVRLFRRSDALLGQLPMLLLMVCYTVGGLTLLLAP